jgi:hypothetical protein
MEKAKRARKAETLKQPSLGLRLRAPYLYPDPSNAQQAAWKRVLREPTATPATKRTQRLRGVCD